MKKKTVYMDYNATAPLLPVAKEEMIRALDLVGNPSSVHDFGRNVRREVETARETIGQAVGCDPINITFTASATEANNMVFAGSSVKTVFISAIEHPCVMEAAKAHKKDVRYIPVDKNGVINLGWLDKELEKINGDEALISIMFVNNEIGVIQPIADASKICKKHNVKFHCDAVQALGKVDLNLESLGVDFVSLSAHKIGGPSGVGALIFDHHTHLNKFIHGGGQERRRRAGTENVIGILGFAAAAKAAVQETETTIKSLRAWRERAEKTMLSAVPQARIFGYEANRVANTIQIALPGVPAQTQLMNLDIAGFAVSSGSACSSGSVKPSHVLQAMGAEDSYIHGALRISMGWNTNENEINGFTSVWIDMAQRLLKRS